MRALERVAVALVAAVVMSCGSEITTGRHYELQGVVVGVDRARQQLVVRHGNIPGFMRAMTTAYALGDAQDLDRVHPGDRIHADLVAHDAGTRLEHIDVHAHGLLRGSLDTLMLAHVDVDAARHEVVIELPPATLAARPAGQTMAMVLEPVYVAPIPTTGAFFAATIELVDRAGAPLPQTLLHHFNLSDPGRRELFLPIGLHVMGASKETPSLTVPRWLFGLPFERGERFLTSAMLANTSLTPYPSVRVRLRLRYEPEGSLWPLFRAYPWVMDVMFPLGHGPTGSKAFDLPPGRSEHSYEATPAIAGTIVGLGGHLHDYGQSLELADLTTGAVLWHTQPIRDSAGHVLSLPVTMLCNWHRLGLHVVPGHRYRVTAVYDNPTGALIRGGGMGAVAGLLVPDRGARWPGVDPSDSLYRGDLNATLRVNPGAATETMDMDMGSMHH